MPIYLQDSSGISGGIAPTMSPFTTSMVGTGGTQPDVDGSLNRAMGKFTASFTGGMLFPRIGADLIGNRDHALSAEPGPTLRTALKKVYYANVGLPVDGGWDNGASKYLSRQEYEDELLGPSSNIKYLTYYSDVMEGGTVSERADKIYNEAGPSGASAFWESQSTGKARNGNPIAEGSDISPYGPYASTGLAISDWWARDGNGFKRSTFGTSFNINITDWTTPDPEGRQYPQYYGDYQLAGKFYTTTSKSGTEKSVGSYGDVTDYRTKTSTIDWAGLGSAQDAQDGWNDGTINQTAAEKWRAGHWAYSARLQNTYAGMIVVANFTTLSRNYSGTDMSVLPYVYDEYHLKYNGGHVQNVTKEPGASSPPLSGVYSDGTLSGGGGSWQQVYNAHVQTILTTKAPHLCNMDWAVDLDDEYDPTESGSELRLARIGLATVLMHNGIFVLNMRTKNYRRVPLIDETGLIGTATSGLSEFWLGARVGPPQLAPVQGTNIWAAEFENGWAVLDSNLPGTAPTLVDIDLFGGTGVVAYINGPQSPLINTGATINADFAPGAFDARILRKV